MADPRRVLHRPTAQHLSEDIGDVLSAIRRLIAEDEALSAADHRLREGEGKTVRLAGNPDDDDADPVTALARRYGQEAPAEVVADAKTQDMPDLAWPLGDLANAPDAARPEDEPVAADMLHAGDEFARILKVVETTPEAAPATDEVDTPKDPRPAPRLAAPERLPLRLGSGQRIALVPERHVPRPKTENWSPLKLADEIRVADTADTKTHSEPVDFDEDFDWKAHMRPEPQTVIAAVSPELADAAAQPLMTREHAASSEPEQLLGQSDAPALQEPEDGSEPSVISRNQSNGLEIAEYRMTAMLPLQQCGDLHLPFGDVLNTLPTSGQALPETTSEVPTQIDALPSADASTDEPVVEHSSDPVSDEEQGIRETLREMIREELLGELGQRYSRNLRAIIRREVAVAIDDQLERL